MCSSCCCSFVHHGRVNRFVLEKICVEITVYEPLEPDLYTWEINIRTSEPASKRLTPEVASQHHYFDAFSHFVVGASQRQLKCCDLSQPVVVCFKSRSGELQLVPANLREKTVSMHWEGKEASPALSTASHRTP